VGDVAGAPLLNPTIDEESLAAACLSMDSFRRIATAGDKLARPIESSAGSPPIRAVHSTTSRLNVTTFCGTRWMVS